MELADPLPAVFCELSALGVCGGSVVSSRNNRLLLEATQCQARLAFAFAFAVAHGGCALTGPMSDFLNRRVGNHIEAARELWKSAYRDVDWASVPVAPQAPARSSSAMRLRPSVFLQGSQHKPRGMISSYRIGLGALRLSGPES